MRLIRISIINSISQMGKLRLMEEALSDRGEPGAQICPSPKPADSCPCDTRSQEHPVTGGVGFCRGARELTNDTCSSHR